jgi:16S rRNA (guanine(966)-N(2))-methyltransferase RsmD
MRVIAGEFRGRRLVAVKGLETRPILDRAKESLFGIIGDEIRDAHVLDLFCGSGTMAIESLSRGAVSAVLVDISRGARAAAGKNITALNIADRVEFIGADACRALHKLAGRSEHFDLIFVDPPYFTESAGPVMAAIREGGLLKPEGLLVFRHHKKEAPETKAPGWEMVRRRQIGDGILTFFRLPEDSATTTMTPETTTME